MRLRLTQASDALSGKEKFRMKRAEKKRKRKVMEEEEEEEEFIAIKTPKKKRKKEKRLEEFKQRGFKTKKVRER